MTTRVRDRRVAAMLPCLSAILPALESLLPSEDMIRIVGPSYMQSQPFRQFEPSLRANPTLFVILQKIGRNKKLLRKKK